MEKQYVEEAFNRALDKFDELSDDELLKIMINPEYRGLYHNIQDMTIAVDNSPRTLSSCIELENKIPFQYVNNYKFNITFDIMHSLSTNFNFDSLMDNGGINLQNNNMTKWVKSLVIYTMSNNRQSTTKTSHMTEESVFLGYGNTGDREWMEILLAA